MSENPFGAPERPPVHRPLWLGGVVIVVGLGGFLAWAATAPLASAAVAPGRITVETNRKTVQHQEGGIIAELLVREGERVRAGQVLARLEDAQSRAQMQALDVNHVAFAAEEARLQAMRDGAGSIRFPAELEARSHDPAVAAVLDGQRQIFEREREVLQGSLDVLEQRIAQMEAQIAAYHLQLRAGDEQLRLIADETRSVTVLVEQGLERRPRMLALQRSTAGLESTQADLRGRVASTRQAIGETRLRIATMRQDHLREVSKGLRDAQSKRAEIGEKLAAASAVQTRRDILSPQDGTVLNLRYFAAGSVIPPGGAVMDIVPDNDKLVVEAKVQPADIETVHAGLPAEVVLSGYKSRTTPRFPATVTLVSADAMVQEKTGESYYLARLEIAPDQLAAAPGVHLLPGMPAEAFIVTGERTALQYLLQPVRDSLRRAFREE